MEERSRSRRTMKLFLFATLVALVACDHTTSDSGETTSTFGTPEKLGDKIEPGNTLFNFKNIYQGAFPPARFPPANFYAPQTFSSFNYPLRTFNLAASPQGILPPISQILPPQISQIVPPIFGNSKPAVPAPVPPPAPIVPSQVFPPQNFPQVLTSVPRPIVNKYAFPYYLPTYQYPYNFPSVFPSTFSFPPNNFFASQVQKQPGTTQPESLSTSYGPPSSEPAEPEPTGPAESSAPFEPSPISYPYEPAVPDTPEQSAPHQPAQEYGIPTK